MTETKHSPFAPSAAHRWLECPGSAWMLKDEPEKTSEAAESGTEAHAIAADCTLRKVYRVKAGDTYAQIPPISADLAETLNTHLALVETTIGGDDSALVLVEERLDLSGVYGIEGHTGTSDLLVLHPADGVLDLIDFKNGFDPVYARDNYQLVIYALAAIEELSLMCDIISVRLIISQPNVRKMPSVWTLTIDELAEHQARIRAGAAIADHCLHSAEMPPEEYFRPGERQCKYCVGCIHQQRFLQTRLQAELDDETALSTAYSKIATMTNDRLGEIFPCLEMIENLVSGIRAEIYRRIQAGGAVPGAKLVAGRRGNKAWTDAAIAEALLKSFKIPTDTMYSKKVVSPTVALKLEAVKSSTTRTKKVMNIITQSDGQPTLAAADDPRPALTFGASEFEDETKINTDDAELSALLGE